MSDNKDRLTYRPEPETKQKIERWYQEDNCRSKNEFIEKAVNCYADMLAAGESTTLPRAVQSAIDSRLKLFEDRIASLLYKQAVEMDMAKRFDRQEHSELDEQVKCAQEELRRDMDAAGRKKLLRLLDAQNTLLVESKLMSFTAGFKLAWGMAKELEADGLYSFEREEEERICHPAEQED